MSRVRSALALVSFAAMAACSSRGGVDGTAAESPLIQTEAWSLTDPKAGDLVGAMRDSGLVGQHTNPTFQGYTKYKASVACTAADACTLVDELSSGAQPIAVTGQRAATIFSLLTFAGVPADGADPLFRVDVDCGYEVYVNGTETNCGMSRSVDKPAPNERSITTGVGATMTWGSLWQQRDLGDSFTEESTYELTYDDAYGYFGDPDALVLTIVETSHVAHHGGGSDPQQTTAHDITLQKIGPHKFKGTFVIDAPGGYGDWQTDIDRLAVAFHVGTKWDSNLGSNYTL